MILTHYGRQLINSENDIKHRKLFNISKIQDKTLYKNENYLNEKRFDKNNKKLRIKTESDAQDFYLNPFDLKNYSVNKILNNINERSHDRFNGQVSKMRENLKTNSAFFLRCNPKEQSTKAGVPFSMKDKNSPNNMTTSSFMKEKQMLSSVKVTK